MEKNLNKIQKKKKELVVICDSFIPEKNSVAIQMYDLCKALIRQNFRVTVICPSSKIKASHEINKENSFSIIRIKNSSSKEKRKIFRAFIEMFVPFKFIFY